MSVLTLAACLVHTFAGDKELRRIEPEQGTNTLKQETWTMARCGWHWISYDLLLATIVLFLLNFTTIIENRRNTLLFMQVFFFGYALVWLLTIRFSKPFAKNYIKLCQWLLLLTIALLIHFS